MRQQPDSTERRRALLVALLSVLTAVSGGDAVAAEGRRPMEFDDLLRATSGWCRWRGANRVN